MEGAGGDRRETERPAGSSQVNLCHNDVDLLVCFAFVYVSLTACV